MDLYGLELNEEQLQAVRCTEGYLRVVAGAGSGKTRVLAARYAYLCNDVGISPDHILCVTFTNKAAGEMRERIRGLLNDEAGGWIATFHGACNKILCEDIHKLNFPKNFMIMDEDDQKSVLKKIYGEQGFTLKDMTYRDAIDKISFYKSQNIDGYIKSLTDPQNKTPAPNLAQEGAEFKIIKCYLAEQRKNFYLDFDDLIYFVLHLLKNDGAAREKWQGKFEYIMVDEYQDVTRDEADLVHELCQKHKNLFVVGDPDQTIYTFRGANVHIFLNFPADYEGARTLFLNKNYRSTPQILGAGNRLISHNRDRIEKELIAVNGAGDAVKYHHAENDRAESQFIADEALKLKAAGAALNDMAVLYRSNYMTRVLEETLLKKGVPYVIYNGFEFFKRSEIKTALCYLRMVAFGDDLSFLRTCNNPPRKIGKTRLKMIKDEADSMQITLYEALINILNKGGGAFAGTSAAAYVGLIEKARQSLVNFDTADLLDMLLSESGYENMIMTEGDQQRLDNIAELKNSIREYVETAREETTLEGYLNYVALLTSADKKDKSDSLKLMTVHTAKGLEFEYVFVCGLNEGIFPSRKIRGAEEMEEERRLAYVAFTRAKKRLYLTDAGGFGSADGEQKFASRFILDADAGQLEITGTGSREHLKRSSTYIKNGAAPSAPATPSDGFAAGEKVMHKIFGEGVVTKCLNGEYTVDFCGKERTFPFSTSALTPVSPAPREETGEQKIYRLFLKAVRNAQNSVLYSMCLDLTPKLDGELFVLFCNTAAEYSLLTGKYRMIIGDALACCGVYGYEIRLSAT